MSFAPMFPPALAYLAGLLLGEAARFFPITVFLFLLLLIPFVYLPRWKCSPMPNGLLLLFVLVFLGLGVRQFSLALPEDDLSRWADRGKLRLMGRVWGLPKHDPEKTRFQLGKVSVYDPSADRWLPTSGNLQVSLGETDWDVLPGELLAFEANLRTPRGYWDPGVFDWGSRLRRLGIRAVAHLSGPGEVKRLGMEGGAGLRAVQKIRDRVRTAIVNTTEGDARALLLSLILGEAGYLSPRLRDLFMASGTAHILSISGSHLGLVALIAFGILRGLVRYLPAPLLVRLSVYLVPSQIAAFFTFFPVLFYALLAGAEVATLRALIMIFVYLSATILGRQNAPLNSLAVAALITMIWDPAAPLDLSFQLSDLSVLILCAVSAYWSRTDGAPEANAGESSRWRKALDRFLFAAAITVSVTVVNLPLTLYHFHQMSWVGLISNWIVVPAAGFIIVPLGLATSLIALLQGAMVLPLAPLQTEIINLWVTIVSGFAHLPGSEVHLPSPPVLLLLALYLIPLAGFLVRGRLRWFFFSFTWTPLLAWAVLASPPSKPSLQITFLDVGQGDAALVRFPGGKNMLIDGGGSIGFDTGRAVLAPFLWQNRIQRIDYVVATHPQLDHIGGLATIVRQFEVGEVWTNGVRRALPFIDQFEESLAQRNVPVRVVRRGQDPIGIGPCLVAILNPAESSGQGREGRALNNGSIALRIACTGFFSALFPGDIEAAAEQAIVRSDLSLRTDVLKVPHHGSRGSLDPEFVAAIHPKVAVISVGSSNRYGHPTKEALSAYAEVGAAIFRTDLSGAIRVEGTGPVLVVRRFADSFPDEVPLEFSAWRKEWENYRRAFGEF